MHAMSANDLILVGGVPSLAQLPLALKVWNMDCDELQRTPHASHVLTLWKMEKKKRQELWKKVKPKLNLEELWLGGDTPMQGMECPMEHKELAFLFPPGSLRGLRTLYLSHARSIGDEALRTLVHAGCGNALTSLTLSCQSPSLILSCVGSV